MLLLTFQADDDGTGELFAKVLHGDFSGESSPWFGIQQLSNFALELESQYPLREVPWLNLEGGYWTAGSPEAVIKQLHLGLEFYPIGKLGRVGCRVSLSTPLQEFGRVESRVSVQVEIQTTYIQVGKFARSLDMLARGTTDEAILQPDG